MNMLNFAQVIYNNKIYYALPPMTGNLEYVVDKLLQYKKDNIQVCYKFNNKMLFSDIVTIDNAYIEVTGMTKSERDKKLKELRDKESEE
jgi:hypothetical protein